MQTTVAGFYGKLPILGDFVSRRLPGDFIATWDDWLQHSLFYSQEQLGEHWLDSYLSAPVWRFVLPSGVCGSQAWTGVIIASVDRVGRYFPFTIAKPVETPRDLSLTSIAMKQWYAKIETIALTALESDLAISEIDNMLFDVKSDDPTYKKTAAAIEVTASEKQSTQKAFYFQADNIDEVLKKGDSSIIDPDFVVDSLWYTQGSDSVMSAMLICEGLPPPTAFSGLLNGKMPIEGWDLHNKRINSSSQPEANQQASSFVSFHDKETLGSGQNVICSWQSQSAIDCGKSRQKNEDALLNQPESGLWVIADGMGGHHAGDVASNMIVDSLKQINLDTHIQQSIQRVHDCLHDVNRQLRRLSIDCYQSQIIGSTVVALIAGDPCFACVWAGDSRLYRLRNNDLYQMTTDHCESMDVKIDTSSGKEQAVKSNNVIIRAVGAFDELELDYMYINQKKGDIFLLCSDGLDKELSPDEIKNILIATPHNAANALMQSVLEKRARDNISIIVVEIR